MEAHGQSERRECWLVRLDRPTFLYRQRDVGGEVPRERLRDLTEERRRIGYRRLRILLAREGLSANHKKLYPIYREEGRGYVADAAASGRLAQDDQWCCRAVQTSAGAWISSGLCTRTDAAYACCAWSITSHVKR